MVMFEAIDDIFQKISNFNEYSRALVTLASAVGSFVIILYSIKIFYRIIQGLRLYVCSQCCCQSNFIEKYGQWAVISGSTDGIGLAMARELARRGMSIVVVGRNEEKLARTKASLEQEPNVGEVETIKIDLSDSSLSNFSIFEEKLDPNNRDIGILINNAGTFPSIFQRYNKFDIEFIRDIANLNMLATLYLTRMVMPGMVARGRGMIMNVSSILGSIPTPYMSIYGPTKTFMDSFTRQLQIEYSSHPLDIILLTPGPVHTKLLVETSRLPRASFVNPTPEDYARSAINASSTRINSFCGTFMHGVTLAVGQLLNYLGLVPLAFMANMSVAAKHFNLSPVPKRRKVVVADAQDMGSGGDRSAVQT